MVWGQRLDFSCWSNVKPCVFRQEGFDGSEVRGQAGNPQTCDCAGRQAPKNLTCDPGHPHRLKGLRDPEAGSAVHGVPALECGEGLGQGWRGTGMLCMPEGQKQTCRETENIQRPEGLRAHGAETAR